MAQKPHGIVVMALLILVACFAFLGGWGVRASDPELSSSTEFFKAAANGVKVSSLAEGRFFTSRLRNVGGDEGNVATGTLGSDQAGEFGPLYDGLVVSSVLLQFPPGSVDVWPHAHPRSTEGLFGLEGGLDVGFVEATSNLLNQTLGERDQFAFPKGLLHFQIDWRKLRKAAKALAQLSTWNPGLERVRLQPKAVFKSKISSIVLSKAFGVCTSVIKGLKAATTSSSWDSC